MIDDAQFKIEINNICTLDALAYNKCIDIILGRYITLVN